MAGPSAASVAALVAAASAPSAPAASFAALELRVAASPARAAEACRRGALRAALPHLLDEAHGDDADAASTRDAAIALLATLVAATPQAAAAALGLASCRGCAESRKTALHATLFVMDPTLSAVPEAQRGPFRLPEQARSVAAALVRLCCGVAVRESTADAAARLALALCATLRRHVRDAAVSALLEAGLLPAAAAAMRTVPTEAGAEDGEESVALRRAARGAWLLAQFFVVAVPHSAKMFFSGQSTGERDAHSVRALIWESLCCRYCRMPEVNLLEACAFALAASRAPPLLALPGGVCGWAHAPRSARATLSICGAALLAAVCPVDSGYQTLVALELARRPGAFAGLVAGVHALVAVRGHVLSPLPPLLCDEPHPNYGDNWKLSRFLLMLFRGATTDFANAGIDEVQLELLSLRMFSDVADEDTERCAGLSFAVFMAAMLPYHEESRDFDRLVGPPISIFGPLLHNFIVFRAFPRRNYPPVPAQHPAPFVAQTLGHPFTQDTALAAVANVLHAPLRSRSHKLPFGAHELASLAFFSMLPGPAKKTPAFALRCVVYMLGRAMRAGGPRDDTLIAWLLRTSSAGSHSGRVIPSDDDDEESQRFIDSRLHRTAVRAAAVAHSLRVVQGKGRPTLWQHAAFLPPFAEHEFLDAFLPYGCCYFSPAAAAARAAEAAKAAAEGQPNDTPLRRFVPPPPAAQAQPRVALLVGDVTFDDVPTSRLATSPLLADLLSVHFATSAPGAPLRLSLGADVSPGAEGATFALLLSCLAAVDENAQAAAAKAAYDAAADAASAAAARRANSGGINTPAPVRYFVMPPHLKRHAAVAFHPDARLLSIFSSLPCDPPPRRRMDPLLLLPAWSAARHLQLDAVTDALGDALTEWLSRQASDSAAWAAARDALAASPADDALKHALLRADIRALARSHAAVLADGGEGAARDAFAAWHERTRIALYTAISKQPAHRCEEELCHWASAMGRALHAEAALLLPTEAWYGRKITLARRAVRTGQWAVG